MPNSLPFPVRVVAGLVATGLDTARRFSGDLPGLGVEVTGALTRAGLRLQQQVSELAARGDELLDGHPDPEEHPAWAHFDDEDVDQAGAADAGPADGGDAAATDDDDGAADADDAGTANDPGAGTADDDDAVAADRDDAGAADPGDAGAGPLPGYAAMSLAQLRGHLRQLSVAQVRELLVLELAEDERPAFVTMLRNRITTLEHTG